MQKWYRLDNAAKAFPPVMTRRTSTIFRLEALLKTDVEVSLLQQGLENIIHRFPYFKVELRRGFFWYYLQDTDRIPRVESEGEYPCMFLPIRRGGCYLFRVIGQGKTMAVEFSHILTDGTGALIFLKALVGEYLRLAGFDLTGIQGIFTRDETPDPGEGEDAYKRYLDNSIPSPEKLSNAFHIPFKLADKNVFHTTDGLLPAETMAARSKEYGVTITEFLSAVFIDTLQTIRQNTKKASRGRAARMIRLEVPVNLRRLYPTKTVRNFTLFVTPGIDLRLGPWSFEDILKVVHHYMKVEVDSRFINRQIARNVRGESHPLVRITPLGLKNVILSLAYKKFGDNLYSGFLTNLGKITLPEVMAGQVEEIRFVPPRNPITKVNCGITGYKDNLMITFGRQVNEPEVERIFFTKLQAMGIPVKVRSGGTEKMICPDCKVEIAQGQTTCPLCGRQLNKPPESSALAKPEDKNEIISLEPKQKWRLGWELFTLLLVSALITVLAVDFYGTRSFTWSRYAAVSLAAASGIMTVFYFLHSRLLLAELCTLIITAVMLFLFDLFGDGRQWFLPLALPLLVLLAAATFFTVLQIKRLKSRGLNVPGFVLMGTAIFCLGLDILINYNLHGRISATWSVIVTISVFPVILFMLFIHYRVRKGLNLKRFFHL